jgi:predicted MFS family arabinose efflux permease
MRRLLVLVCAIVLVDTSFYAAITPLLPYYADHEHLTKTGAGILAGSYAAGTLAASLPAGAWTARYGPRALLICGLALLAVTSVTFGLARQIVLLDVARFAQGVGGALSWTAGLAWLSSVGPPGRRSELMGTAIGAATGGALLGPVLGAVARAVGPAPAFGFVAAVAVVLLVLMLTQPIAAPERGDQRHGLLAALRADLVPRGLWFVVCASLFFGVLNVLLPLRMDHLGASGAAIASVFLVSAGLEVFVNPLAGRWGDRRGFVALTRVGLLASGVIALVASLPDSATLLAAIGMTSGPLVGLLWIPGFALLSYGSDAAGIDHSYAYALLNVVWAGAQTAGAAGGGALANATEDVVPYAVVAALALGTLVVGTRPRSLHRTHPAMTGEA